MTRESVLCDFKLSPPETIRANQRRPQDEMHG
jgi:hypothetical protein